MKRRTLLTCVVLPTIVVGCVVAGHWSRVTFAQKQTVTFGSSKSQPSDQLEDPFGSPLKPTLQAPRPSNPIDDFADEVAPVQVSNLQRLLANDPERAAEEFVKQTSSDAKQAIEQLRKDAESLRVRLKKTEAALNRLQVIVRAFDERSLQTPEGNLEPTPQIGPEPIQPRSEKPTLPK
jgi:hypothetical protein